MTGGPRSTSIRPTNKIDDAYYALGIRLGGDVVSGEVDNGRTNQPATTGKTPPTRLPITIVFSPQFRVYAGMAWGSKSGGGNPV